MVEAGSVRAEASPIRPEERLRLCRQVETTYRRERAVLRAFRERYGEEAERVCGLTEKDLVSRDRPPDLASLAGNAPVTAWLRALLERTVRDEARLYSRLLGRFGEEGFALARRAVFDFGASCGREARAERRSPSARGLFRDIADRHLHGLPSRDEPVVEARSGSVVVRRTLCPNEAVWKEVGAPALALCALDRAWLDGFCEGFGAGLRHRAGGCVVGGAVACEDRFGWEEPGARPSP